jgi:hypothetical protein
MYDTAREMGFGLMAGSSIPITRRMPAIDMPLGAEVEEAMCVCFGGVDSYDFHGLETIQCMVERRKGGETGVVALQALRGEAVWKAMKAGSWAAGGWDPVLFEACLSRSHTLTPARETFNDIYPSLEEMQELVKRPPGAGQRAGRGQRRGAAQPAQPGQRQGTGQGQGMVQGRDPVAYRYEYADGIKATMFLLNGVVSDFNFAARLKGQKEPLSTQMYYTPGQTTRNIFSPLAHHIETFFHTGKSPYPVERTLLTTGLTAMGVESLYQGQKRLETPHLAIHYQPTKESTYWRS